MPVIWFKFLNDVLYKRVHIDRPSIPVFEFRELVLDAKKFSALRYRKKNSLYDIFFYFNNGTQKTLLLYIIWKILNFIYFFF